MLNPSAIFDEDKKYLDEPRGVTGDKEGFMCGYTGVEVGIISYSDPMRPVCEVRSVSTGG